MRTVISPRTIGILQDRTPVPSGIKPDSYRERLLKYIPAEILVLYVAVYGSAYAIAASDPLFPLAARWILIAGIVAVPLYLMRAEGVTDWVQLVISTAGFVLWTAALGVVPVADLPGYNQVAASIFLPAYVFLSPLIEGIPEQW